MEIILKNTENIVIGRDSKLPIAVFMFHSWNGVLDTVLISDIATTDETELLCKIAYQYAANIANESYNGNPRYKVWEIFQGCFDEFTTSPEKESRSDRHFNKECGKLIKSTYKTAQKAVNEIIKRVKDASGVSISIEITDTESVFQRSIYTVSLSKNSKNTFTFWTADNWPEEEKSWDLHIIPGYHPSSPSQGKNSYGMLINGSTDALISSKTISSVYSPMGSRKNKDKFSGSSWNYMKHPCKASGKKFQFNLRGYYGCTTELVEDAVKLILSALGAHPEGNYVGVSGGFYPTYDFPQNISNRTGKQLPCETPRGSEKHCMWTYDVLEKENELEKAYIPKWFFTENWIGFFKEQEGIFPSFK